MRRNRFSPTVWKPRWHPSGGMELALTDEELRQLNHA